jgi:hypothetical protein
MTQTPTPIQHRWLRSLSVDKNVAVLLFAVNRVVNVAHVHVHCVCPPLFPPCQCMWAGRGRGAIMTGFICLSSAKLRSTDSVNPRAVLSRTRPRYLLYSRYRDIDGISPGTYTGDSGYKEPSYKGELGSDVRGRRRRNKEQPAANGVAPNCRRLSKTAHSGPSVCVSERETSAHLMHVALRAERVACRTHSSTTTHDHRVKTQTLHSRT